jgi:hypothetical protein
MKSYDRASPLPSPPRRQSCSARDYFGEILVESKMELVAIVGSGMAADALVKAWCGQLRAGSRATAKHAGLGGVVWIRPWCQVRAAAVGPVPRRARRR